MPKATVPTSANLGFEEKMAELSAELYEQITEGVALVAAIRKNLEALGYGE